ncbi:MAG: Rpp14/Pop5 family protein [Candidatus Aenigmatarchaeota archaeon]
MSEPKMLPPVLRSGKRYIVFEVISDGKINYDDIMDANWDSMLSFLGELNVSLAKPWLIKSLYDEENQRGVIKCGNDYVEQVRAALSLIQIISEKKVIIKILGVTGTIKSAKMKYMEKSGVGLYKFGE